MTEDIASALLRAAKTGDLRLRPIVLLDWHDGPLEGIAELAGPVSYWYFRLLGERASTEVLDDRIYLFARIAESALENIDLSAETTDRKPLVWPFDEWPNSAEIRSAVNDAVASSDAPTLIIHSITFREIEGIWRFARGAFQPQPHGLDRSK